MAKPLEIIILKSIKHDELVISQNLPFYVIPAKAGHVVKPQRYPVFSTGSGLPFSRE